MAVCTRDHYIFLSPLYPEGGRIFIFLGWWTEDCLPRTPSIASLQLSPSLHHLSCVSLSFPTYSISVYHFYLVLFLFVLLSIKLFLLHIQYIRTMYVLYCVIHYIVALSWFERCKHRVLRVALYSKFPPG